MISCHDLEWGTSIKHLHSACLPVLNQREVAWQSLTVLGDRQCALNLHFNGKRSKWKNYDYVKLCSQDSSMMVIEIKPDHLSPSRKVREDLADDISIHEMLTNQILPFQSESVATQYVQ